MQHRDGLTALVLAAPALCAAPDRALWLTRPLVAEVGERVVEIEYEIRSTQQQIEITTELVNNSITELISDN